MPRFGGAFLLVNSLSGDDAVFSVRSPYRQLTGKRVFYVVVAVTTEQTLKRVQNFLLARVLGGW